MEEENDWKNLSIIEKISHKSWKARVDGYALLDKEVLKIDDQSKFSAYINHLKTVPNDANLSAQEKGLELILKISRVDPGAFKLVSHDLLTGIVNKCLNTKPKTKSVSFEIFLQFIENSDSHVVDCLKIGLSVKQPKIICGCVEALTRSLADFGPTAFPPKPFILDCIKLLEHSDKNVRDSVKNLIIELYKWIKSAISVFITNIKPIQLKELEEEFKKYADLTVSPTRYIGGEPKNEESNADENDENIPEAAGVESFDPYEMVDPVDVSSNIPPGFLTEIAEAKWQIRKEALEKLEKVLNVPKIKPADFSDVLSCLKKVLSSDSNIIVVSCAVKCVQFFATGLRRAFANDSTTFMPLILDKFKEKRGAIVENCRQAIDSFLNCLEAETIINIVHPYFKNKSPSVKEESIKCVDRLISKSAVKLSKPAIKSITIELSKALEDNLANIREATFEVLAKLMKIYGEQSVMIYLDNLDDIKKSKLSDVFKSISAPSVETQKKISVKAPEDKPIEDKKPPAAVPKTTEVKSISKPTISAKPVESYENDQKEPNDISVQESDVVESAVELFGQEVVDGLSTVNWKNRLTSMEALLSKIKEISLTEKFNVIHIYKLISLKPGWKDSNFQVLKAKFQVMSYLTTKSDSFPRRIVHDLVPILADKISDNKLKEQVVESLLDFSDVSSVNFVDVRVIFYFNTTKNVKNQIEILSYLSRSITDFGLKIDVKCFVDFCKKSLDSPNQDIRKGTIELMKTMYMFIGDKFMALIEDLKPPLLQSVQAEIEKVKGLPVPKPSRIPAKVIDSDSVPNDQPAPLHHEYNQEEPIVEIDMESLITRIDISQELTPELLEKIKDKNWKLRNEGLEKLSEIFTTNKHIQPTIGELPNVLVTRLTDSNKNLITIALNICKNLINALGKNVEQYRSVLIPEILGTLSDGKPQIRAAAISCLDAWIATCGTLGIIDSDEPIILPVLTGKNSSAKSEIMTWLSQVIRERNIKPATMDILTPHILLCINDRNADTRKSAQVVIGEIAARGGASIIEKHLSSFDSSSLNVKSVLTIIQKTVASAAETNQAVKDKPVHPDEQDKQTRQTTKESEAQAAVQSKKPKVSDVPAAILEVSVNEEPAKKQLRLTYLPDSKKVRLKEASNGFSITHKEFPKFLHNQLSLYLQQDIMNHLQSPDFKKQCLGIQSLSSIILEPLAEDEILGLLECSDLIVGFASFKLIDANPSLLSNLLKFLNDYMELLINRHVTLRQDEADWLLPQLINRLSDNKETYRKMCRELIYLSTKTWPASTIITHLFAGMDSKLVKIRSESITCINNIIQSNNIAITDLPNFSKITNEMGKLLSERDSTFRNLALAFFTIFYEQVSEKIYDYVGQLGTKEVSLLKDKFKKLSNRSLNKTFNISTNTSQIATPTNITVVNTSIETESEVLETTLVEQQSSKPVFKLEEFLMNNGITIEQEIIQPTPVSLDFDSKYEYKEIQSDALFTTVHIDAFVDLEKNIKQNCFSLTQNNEQLYKLPTLFDNPKLSDQTLSAMDFCQSHLLLNFFNSLEQQCNHQDYICLVFHIINYIFHTSSFVKYLPKETLKNTVFLLINIIESVSANTTSNSSLITRNCKGILCAICEFMPAHNLLFVFCKLLNNEASVLPAKSYDILTYLIEIVCQRLRCPYACVNMDIDEFLASLENNYTINPRLDHPQHPHCDILKVFEELFNSFQFYVSTHNHPNHHDINTRFSKMLKRDDIPLPASPATDVRSVPEVIDALLEEFDQNIDQRLMLSKTIFSLSIEHDYSLKTSLKFSSLKPNLRLFLRLYFDYLKNHKINSIMNISESNEPETKFSFDYYMERAKQFKNNVDLINVKPSSHLKTPREERAIEGISKDTIDILMSQNILPTNTSQDERQSLRTNPKNIEDLKRRFENIKKAFKD